MRVAVVGSGFVAGLQTDALAGVPGVEIAGVVDVDPARAAAAAGRAGGVPSATDLDEALRSWQPDGAVVCTPNDTHVPIGIQLAEAGVPALMEKPLATTPDGAAELVRAFDAHGVSVTAAHTHRYADYARAVHDVLRAGEVGRPVHARVTMLGGWIWGDWRGWQISRDRSGGHALHNGVHLLDLVGWWLDDQPTHVHARGQRRASTSLEIHDYLLITLRYASGATAVCEMSRANRPRSLTYREVFVQGTSGSLRLPWDAEAPFLLTDSGAGPIPGGADPFAAQARAWVASIRGAAAPAVSGLDGWRAVVLGTAAERSLATAQVIDVASLQDQTRPATGEPQAAEEVGDE